MLGAYVSLDRILVDCTFYALWASALALRHLCLLLTSSREGGDTATTEGDALATRRSSSPSTFPLYTARACRPVSCFPGLTFHKLMILTLLLANVSLTQITAVEAVAPHNPIGRYSIRVHGPSTVDDTVGVIRVFTFRADWRQTIRSLRSKLKMQSGLNEFDGFSGMRYFWNSTDHSFNWDSGKDFPGIGLVRDFRARPHIIDHPYAPRLYGRRAKGWISIYTFDGTFVDRR